MENTKRFSIWPWVLRGVLVILALSAPIVTYKAFTDPETGDPIRQERLNEAEERNRLQRERNRTRANFPPQNAPIVRE